MEDSKATSTTQTGSEKKARPITCIVESDKMDKSRVAYVERIVKHARYGKYIQRRTRIMFHDPENKTKVGDKALVEVSRPYSKRKKFSLVKILSSGAAQ